jgi:hypothetical protein
MAFAAAIFTPIRVEICFLSLFYRFAARWKRTQEMPVGLLWKIKAITVMNFMIAIGLGLFIYVIKGHALSFNWFVFLPIPALPLIFRGKGATGRVLFVC